MSEDYSKIRSRTQAKIISSGMMITLRKDLSTMYCASSLGYNRNLSNNFKDLRNSKKTPKRKITHDCESKKREDVKKCVFFKVQNHLYID